EGRPNVLAVGDDDQAIYAFQGADHANMAEFARHYTGVKVISLAENYRSTNEVLAAAKGIAEQIDDRLHEHFAGITKDIEPAAKDLPKSTALDAREFKSDAAQYEWVAQQIKHLHQKEVVELS